MDLIGSLLRSADLPSAYRGRIDPAPALFTVDGVTGLSALFLPSDEWSQQGLQ
jgi:hypothetical protein